MRNPSLIQLVCYIVTLLRALSVNSIFLVDLVRYYECFFVNRIFFFSRTLSLLRYYERFSVNSIFFSWTVTLLRYWVLFCKQYFFSWTVTLRYDERFSVNSKFFQSICYIVTLLRVLFCKQNIFKSTWVEYFHAHLLCYCAITSAFL